MAACQSTPPGKIVTQKPVSVAQGQVSHPASPAQSSYKPLPLKTGIAGLTDTNWDIVSLKSKNPQVFVNRPYLFLQSATQRVWGSTGCNALRGGYETESANNIRFQAFAGHMSCDNALAQEADIMDALSRVATYQVQQDMLFLYDQQGQLILTARRR
ncbi:META domain-containing protein [Alkanindiges sp. WGS2144]|uniref:META domain-containing protein n=1 Tax=Alkanindiges sp. WGS2144 TaxID=3366808 RepID=UPI0037516534